MSLFSHNNVDVDECSSNEKNDCNPNAMCTNTEGSYVCRCIRGFEGDGRNCTGIFFFSVLNNVLVSEDLVDHRSYIHNLSSSEIKGLNGIWTHGLCDTVTVLYRLDQSLIPISC